MLFGTRTPSGGPDTYNPKHAKNDPGSLESHKLLTDQRTEPWYKAASPKSSFAGVYQLFNRSQPYKALYRYIFKCVDAKLWPTNTTPFCVTGWPIVDNQLNSTFGNRHSLQPIGGIHYWLAYQQKRLNSN